MLYTCYMHLEAQTFMSSDNAKIARPFWTWTILKSRIHPKRAVHGHDGEVLHPVIQRKGQDPLTACVQQRRTSTNTERKPFNSAISCFLSLQCEQRQVLALDNSPYRPPWEEGRIMYCGFDRQTLLPTPEPILRPAPLNHPASTITSLNDLSQPYTAHPQPWLRNPLPMQMSRFTHPATLTHYQTIIIL